MRFVRKTFKLLSNHRQLEDNNSSSKSRSQRQQQQQQQQQQRRRLEQQLLSIPQHPCSPSTKQRSEVHAGDLSAGADVDSDPACTPARAANPQTQPKSDLEADSNNEPQSSVPAIGTAIAGTANNHNHWKSPAPIGRLLSTSSTIHSSSPIDFFSAASVVQQDRAKQQLLSDSADSELTSNFPFRPLRLQTLSPNADNHQILATRRHHSLFESTIPRSTPSRRPASDETGIAMQRKVWVKRPGAPATRVEVNEDDLVDNVRDVILHKYANSLGRHIDSPDITLKIASREQANKNAIAERVLGPEESIGNTLDTYYPGGQTIEEALVIEVPQKRTPKPSPRPGNHQVHHYLPDDYRPGDGARDYFPPMPLQSPHLAQVQHAVGPNGVIPVHSMSVLTTGHVPPLPSPGGQHNRLRHVRPKYPRQHTSSPTIVHSSQVNGIDAKPQVPNTTVPAPPLPTPPAAPGDKSTIIPPNRTTSPHSNKPKKRRQIVGARDGNGEPTLPTKPASAGLLDGRVPPINVLLVEDNVINLKLLEQFMKRLKVRWSSAMNGREAVNMWRQGGFHLVLMDIQLPVMNGLEATKEIRRLESVNGIGLSVFGESTMDGKGNSNGQLAEEDKLKDRELFKSPVIIVALTASSLQSDRHEALAVGCNDFLTKPVNFVWMERKVTEWGCMQALIDFNGWRRWKAIAEKKMSEDPEKRKQEEKDEKAKAKAALKAMFSRSPPSTKRDGSVEPIPKDDTSLAPTSSAGNTSANNTDQTPARRTHKSSRSQSGGLGTSLGITLEVDEKDA